MRYKKMFTMGVVAIAATALLSGCTQISKSGDPSTNVDPTKGFVFNNVETLTALPGLKSTPDEINGWKTVSKMDEAEINQRTYLNDKGCTFSVMSQQSPSEDLGQGDFYLSKKTAYLTASIDESELTKESMIKVKTGTESLDFVSGEYNPKVTWNASVDGSNPKVVLDEPWTTFIAVRTIDNPIALADTTIPTGPSELDRDPTIGNDDSKYAEGEISTSLQTIPSVIIKYSCKTVDYNEADVKNMIDQITLDLSTKK